MRDTDPRVVLGLHRSRHERRLLTGALDLGVTALDTSSNYLRFRSHEVLARVAGDLLPKFTLSTKVGYFPGPDRAEHSLDPARLHIAMEQAVKDLGREPDLVFLHNPEHSLEEAAPRSRYVLAQACAALDIATSKGLCGGWGVASWEPSPLVDLVDEALPRPSVLMVRAGLLVGTKTLDAADAVATAWGLDSNSAWGMSPFGGSTRAPVWERINPGVFLRGGDGLSPVQAAFRTAYCLPRVSTMAVGTDEPAHLGELMGALASQVNEQAVREYRDLIRARSRGQPA
ncbi:MULTISPECIES: aldo/keto reductase [unclassified Streptomyces]|uniref:aldo/keto reductase n=1 Tax=unclassified Streptomyces TaxID=2593676 RepID=UPI001371968F|nr:MULTISPECIES: aldo/keto reductase [unclassified Streptomyces]NDZ99858.1 aldo/keto reductase [Streptomyces sp. SID10116]MYY86646.1 aldo/keto reductase [Streptomyces sp. SID335]MYZ14359.1 aldo/keto reductase [Streptomyces sp. SID337]NDZ85872.1 aldo/keto reductase [Streptomyces sp. SID10115]NEB49226.1 aldo/keto reductase [Streptomyces sp. SID339]